MNPKLASEIMNQVVEYVHYGSSPRSPSFRNIKTIRWERRLEGWMKLNTNGSSIDNLGRAGCGGVMRDECGRLVGGFIRSIGITSSFTMVLQGIRDGLILCYNLNISSLVVEIDAKALVDVLENPEYVNNIVSSILDDCRFLAARFSQIQFKHCYQQANQCIESLARMSSIQCFNLSYFVSSLEDVVFAFENDLKGMYFNRLCPEPIVVNQFLCIIYLPKKNLYPTHILIPIKKINHHLMLFVSIPQI